MKPLSERRFDVLCAGEALVDFLPETRGRLGDVETWRRAAGGSPANVATGLARLGARVRFLGVVGDDELGGFLSRALEGEGIDVALMRRAEERTGIVFISLDEKGERSFTDYRKPSAELLFSTADVARVDFEQVRTVHFSLNSLVFPEAAKGAREMVRRAKAAGCVLSCDPNLRLHFWPDPAPLKELVVELLPQMDVVKLAEDEIEFCTGERDPEQALRRLEKSGIGLPVVTLGERGALYARAGELIQVAAPKVEAVDLTGAGDGFDAGLLAKLSGCLRSDLRLDELSAEQVREAVGLGCEIGAAVVTRLGAVAGLPRRPVLEDRPGRER